MKETLQKVVLDSIRQTFCDKFGPDIFNDSPSEAEKKTNEEDEEEDDSITINTNKCLEHEMKEMSRRALNQIIIEFFTINLFILVRDQLRNSFLAQIEQLNLTTRQEIMDASESIDTNIRQEFCLNCHYEIINKANCLKSTFINTFNKRIFEIFSQPTKLKFLLKIIDKKPKQQEPDHQEEQTNPIQIFNSFTRKALNKLFFPKIFCQNLFYNSDLNYANNLIRTILTDDSILNKLIKSLTGIAASLGLTWLFYFYFRFQLRIDAEKTTIFVLIISIVLLYCLTFSRNRQLKAIVLLMIPFMASNRARSVLVLNCFVLSTTLIIPNIIQNLNSLHQSYLCNMQIVGEQIEQHVKREDGVQMMLKRAKSIRKNALKKIEDLKRVQKKVARYSRKAANFLDKAADTCRKSANPVETCQNGLNKIIEQCWKDKENSKTDINKKDLLCDPFPAHPYCLAEQLYDYIKCWCLERTKFMCEALRGPQALCVGATKAAGKVGK